MRAPSRSMPAVGFQTGGAGAVLATPLMAAAVAGLAYAGYRALAVAPWLSVAVVLAIGAVTVSVNRRRVRDLNAIAAKRAGESICQFARAFDRRTVDTWIIRASYEAIQQELADVMPDFPVHVGDRITRDLGIDPEDLYDDLMPAIARRCGRVFVAPDKQWQGPPITTVGDLVHALHALTLPPARQ